jgi:hypothetical protein
VTEAEWLDCDDPRPMLEFLHGKASDRKMRLFVCACCRRIWHLLVDERSRKAVEVVERFIDGNSDSAALETAMAAATALDREGLPPAGLGENYNQAALAALSAIRYADVTAESHEPNAWIYAAEDAAWHARYAVGEGERSAQALLLRELFGPLAFRRLASGLARLSSKGGVVQKLAQLIYDDQAFDRLPILADALEEAGCTDADVLAHCRSPGPHVRGCWLVDLLLNKS